MSLSNLPNLSIIHQKNQIKQNHNKQNKQNQHQTNINQQSLNNNSPFYTPNISDAVGKFIAATNPLSPPMLTDELRIPSAGA